MSSPIVSTFQPGRRRDQHREVRLAASARERGREVLDLALGRGELEDQHVLGRASPRRGPSPTRSAARSTSCRAARCRRSPSRRTRSRASRGSARCTCSRRCTATGTSLRPCSSGQPTECTHGTNSPSSPSTSSAGRPIRVMIRIERRDVRGVGQLHADVGDRRAERAHRERHHVHRAAQHRAVEQLRQRGAHLVRLAPVVGRARVRLALGADERAVLDPRDVVGVRQRQVGVRTLGVDSRSNVPASTSVGTSRSYSSAEPSHQWIRSGWVSAATSSTQAMQAGVRGSGLPGPAVSDCGITPRSRRIDIIHYLTRS